MGPDSERADGRIQSWYYGAHLLNDWNLFEWPAWVPQEVRDQITNFWTPDCGRSPHAWLTSCGDAYSRQQPMGTRVRCRGVGSNDIYEGLWVPAWSNIGRVVLADGSYKVSSTCFLKVL